uniref:5-histidylcysteine sulfoxide synthase n=1 Tax=Thaumasiovibrio occultus TaxID=1891184 RepID=UPI000B34B86C|nr:5-histidylcysteine sulfoxide synthase [Thaumasiovibrio occultus]
MPQITGAYHSTISLTGESPQAKREELKAYFNHTYRLYESLFTLINSDDAYYLKAEPLRHPLIFYFGHTACFFINKLKLAQIIDSRLNPKFESMFAIGVDEMSWDDLDERNYDWPSVESVRQYRRQVQDLVNQVIDTMPLELPISQSSPAWVILMGIEHERIHLETSSVIIRQLGLEWIAPSPAWPMCEQSASAPQNQLIAVAGSKVTLGKVHEDLSYGWDNEYGRHSTQVAAFKASQYLVSNNEFLAFVEAGGYQKSEFWDDEGQRWLAYTKATMPRFWRFRDGKYWQRNLTAEMPLPMDWPVEVNQLEAQAFCRWKAEQLSVPIRLPTESEWYVLRDKVQGDAIDWGNEVPGNIELAHYASSVPVTWFEHNGFYDVIGNVWQWTVTPIDGFSGFAVHPLYDDFSTPTFDGKHNLIKGGSWISTGNEAMRSSRYAFRRHFYQHAGFRYVEAEPVEQTQQSVNMYETDELVSQYLEMHFGKTYFDVPNFSEQLVELVIQSGLLERTDRALDIGCSVGRATLELSKYFNHVDGIDFSARFIQQAYQLSEQGEVRYTIPTEGELVEFKSITLDELGLSQVDKSKIHFSQGDATNLKPQFSGYDAVLAANLIDRLSDPAKFLNAMKQRVNSGGILAIASPYTWLEAHTAKGNWLGGKKVNGENQTTLEGLTEQLADAFTLEQVQDVPFVIRETRRKFQHTVSQLSLWRRK